MFKCEIKKVYVEYLNGTIDLSQLPCSLSCDLLLAYPELIEARVEWKLKHSQWLFLLLRNDNFAKICDWESLNGNIWSILIRKKPYLKVYAEERDWLKLSSNDWVNLLKLRPEFIKYCPNKKRIEPKDWVKILKFQPQMLSDCCVEELTPKHLYSLLAIA